MNYNAENERGVSMIYDTLEHAGQYRKLSGNLAKALDYLTGTELETVEAGRVEIDGERVFALFQSYETKPENDRPEAHRKYIDIQYLIEGEELIGVAPLASMERVAEAAPGVTYGSMRAKRQSCRSAAGGLRSSFRRTRTRRASPRASAGRCGRSCSRSPLNRRNEPGKNDTKNRSRCAYRIGSGFTIYSVTASIAAAYHAPPFGQTNASS